MLKMFLDALNYFLNNCNITYWVLKHFFFRLKQCCAV